MDHLKYCMSKMRGVNDEFTSWVLSSHWYKIQERNKWQTHCVWVGNKNLIFVPWYWAVSCSVFIPVMDPLLGRDALIMTNNEIHLILKLQPSPLKQVGSVTNPKCQYLTTWGWESFIFLQEATFVFSFLHFVEMMCNSTCVHMLSNSDIKIGSKAKRAHTVLYTTCGSFLVCFSHYDFRFGQAACQWLTAQRWHISPPHSHMGSVSQHGYSHLQAVMKGELFQELEMSSRAWWGGGKTPETRVGTIVVYWTSTFSDVYSYSKKSQGLWFLYSSGVNSLFDMSNWEPTNEWTKRHWHICHFLLFSRHSMRRHAAGLQWFVLIFLKVQFSVVICYWQTDVLKVIYLKPSITIRKK